MWTPKLWHDDLEDSAPSTYSDSVYGAVRALRIRNYKRQQDLRIVPLWIPKIYYFPFDLL